MLKTYTLALVRLALRSQNTQELRMNADVLSVCVSWPFLLFAILLMTVCLTTR